MHHSCPVALALWEVLHDLLDDSLNLSHLWEICIVKAACTVQSEELKINKRSEYYLQIIYISK